MQRIRKMAISILLAASMVVGGIPAIDAKAADAVCEIYSGGNVENQNYTRTSRPIASYLTALADGSLMRVQYGSQIEGLLVEYYDKDYKVVSSGIVAEELPIFGGFYATESNYFVVTGQTNTEESAEKEVFRITKYDKDWNRIASAGLSNCNTTIPFDAGSCRMDVCGNYLLIRTSHEMYTSSDGKNHQSNVTIEVDMETMAITDSYTAVMNSNMGYVSHSFNQFIKIDDNKIVAVDHGDAYPRSIVVLKYQTDVSGGKFVPNYFDSPCSVIHVLEFPGQIGQNATGASIGGFEISDSNYLIAGNSVVQDEDNLTRSTRNVFVAAVDKTTSAVSIKLLTSYEEGNGTTSTPQLVKISSDEYLVLWSRDGKVYYTAVDGTGEQSDSIYSIDGQLSDCVPVIFDGKIVWYTWNEKVMTFYDIDVKDLSLNRKTEIVNGHQYENQGVTDGVALLKCSVCQAEEQMKVATIMNVFWNEDGGYDWTSVYNSDRQVGDELYCLIEAMASDVNDEMEIISSDDSVASVQIQSNRSGVIQFHVPGEVTITVRPKYNPDNAQDFHMKVLGTSGNVANNTCEHIESEPITDREATCKEPGIAHTECTICHEELQTNVEIAILENHSWDDGNVTKQPTTAEEGIKTFTCMVCGETKTESIEKLEDDKTELPDTSESETPNKPDTSESDTPKLPDTSESETPNKPDTSESETPKIPDTSENDTPKIPDTSESETSNIPDTKKPNEQQNNKTNIPESEKPQIDGKENQPQTEPTVTLNETVVKNGVKYKVIKSGKSGQAEVAVVSGEKNKTTVTIPSTVYINNVKCNVTTISVKAFYKNEKIKKVVIGKNVKNIGQKAFYNCKSLKNITIKSTVLKKVGKQAIKGIHKKAVIKVPKKKLEAYKRLFGNESGFVKAT